MWADDFFKLFLKLGIPKHMMRRAEIGFKEMWKPIKTLLEHQSLPEDGWNDKQIKMLLNILSSFDSDGDPRAIRIGEREARISTPLLAELSAGFNHGVGRSGQLSSPQPKAIGASLMQKLADKLVLSLIKNLGLVNVKAALATPLGTGMSIALSLKGCLNYHSINIHEKPYVLYCRADHKSPMKGLELIGAHLKIIDGKFGINHFAPSGVFVDIHEIREIYKNIKDSTCAIISTTSFFAPRVPDNIKEIAKFAKENNLIHIVNNAYGIQSTELLNLIRAGIDAGRIDAVVQSTDKNFLTPVGGAVVISPNKKIIESISNSYAGRASAAPILYLLVSLLSMGISGYKHLLMEQLNNSRLLKKALSELANNYNEEIIECNNTVSYAMTLKNLNEIKVSELGGHLYNLRVTGPRVIDINKSPFGTCTSKFPCSYVVINAAIGVNEKDIIDSIKKLEEALSKLI